MKDAYQSALRQAAWSRLCAMLFLLLPFIGLAQGTPDVTLTPTDPQAIQDFGDVVVGQSTPFANAKTFTLSGSNLDDTRAVRVAVPEGFQASFSQNSGYTSNNGAFLSVFPTGGTVAPRTVYLRFAPLQQITYNDFLNASQQNGRNSAFSIDIPVRGRGIAGPPEILVSPIALGFQPQIINTNSAAETIDVTGNSLSSVINVTAPAGFLVSVGTGALASSAQLPATGGTVNVVFRPTVAQAYVGNVTFSSTGAPNRTVSVSGQGLPQPTTLTVTQSNLNFPQTDVGSASPFQSFNVNGSGLGTNDVTITAPANFQVRVGTAAFSNSATITPVNGSVTNVAVDVRFTPNSTGTITEQVTVSAPNATTQNVTVRGTGQQAAPGATVTLTPNPLNFGAVTRSGSGNTLTLTVSGTRLNNNPTVTLTPSNANIQIRNVSTNGSFSSAPIVLTPIDGTVAPTTIEVRLVGPIPAGSFSGSIVATSTAISSPVTANVTAVSNGNVSDISITNAANNSFTFATRPGTISATQVFEISGTNLLNNITIAPTGPAGFYFQLSKDNVTFSSSVTYQRDANGNVVQAPVYVRFVPGTDAVTVNALIRASSTPAPDRDVSVTGISEPTVRLVQSLGFFGNDVVKNTTTAPRSVRLEAFLLTGPLNLYFPQDRQDQQRNPDFTPQYEFSTDGGTTYVKADTLLNNGQGNRVLDLLVRYAPTRVGAATQSLMFQNAVLNNNVAFSLTSRTGDVNGFAIAAVPAAQSTAEIVRAAGSTRATLTFNLTNPPAGQTYGQNRLVIASSKYSQLPTALFPQLKQNFNPGITIGGDYQYGSGSVIEAGNTFVVFSGAATTFTVGNLDPNVRYYFYAFEFNDDGLLNAENYRVPNNQPQNPLPVELISFEARLRNGSVLLSWATAMEKNNRGFEIERSANARDFASIGFKPGQGNTANRTEYNHIDERPLAGVSYYRLKQIDFDGKVTYSPVLTVRNGRTAEVAVFPNPVDEVLNIRLAEPGANTQVTVLDLLGRTVLTGKLTAEGAFNTSSLKPGNYLIRVTNGTETSTHKITKR